MKGALMNKPQTQVSTFASLGIVAATLDESGKFLALDFAGLDGADQLLRVVFPAEQIKTLAAQLGQLVAAMEDTGSGIRMPKTH
jgi:hypothetical protein